MSSTYYHSFSLRHLHSPDALFNSHSRCVNRLGTIALEAITLYFPKLDSTDVRRLPPHLKTLIIEYLVARDCLTEQHLLLLLDEYQNALNFSNCSRITDKALALVAARCPRLRSLEMANCPLVTSKGLEALYSRYSVTGTLDLSKAKGVLTTKTARAMGRNCRALTSLVLDECDGVKVRAFEELVRSTGGFLERVSLKRSTCTTDAWLAVIANHCPALKHLNVKGCPLVSTIGIGHVIFQCRQLESLNISGLKSVPTADLTVLAHGLPRGLLKLNVSFTPGVTDDVVQTVAAKCPLLERLDLRGIFGLKGAFLYDLCTKVAGLHSLRLDLCKDIEDEHIARLYQPRRTRFVQPFVLSLQLRTLSLSGVKNLTDQGVRALARSCPLLRSVNLSGLRHISDACLVDIAAACGQLESVNLSLCGQLTDAALADFVRQRGKRLRYLTLHGTSGGEQTLQAIAACCRKLLSLSLYHFKNVTAEAVAAAVCANPFLRHVDVSNIHAVDDDAVKHIARTCHYLNSFYAIACAQLTDDSLAELTLNCPDLAWINLNSCPRITSNLLAVMARNLKYLTYISLSGCNLVSDPGFLLLGRGCPMLKTILLSTSSAVSVQAIRMLTHDRPSLNLVFN